MVDLAARHAVVAELVEDRVLATLRGGRYVGGELVAEAEALAAHLFGRGWAVGVNSGTDALVIALQAAGLAPGDEVIVPALTFFATAGAVVAAGMTPVVVDVGEDALIDGAAAARARSSATRAIIPVHLYGGRAAVPDLDLVVVDDLAQAVGARPMPSSGALGAISTYPTKTWGGAGDGGFVVGDDAELHARARMLGAHGTAGTHLHVPIGNHVGRNSRLDAIQAAVLLGQATNLHERVTRRRALAARYDAGLPEAIRPLPRGDGHPVHQYVVRVRERDRIVAHLDRRGIDVGVYYPRGLHRQPALATAARLTDCPVADRLSEQLLALPVHAQLTDADVDRVLAALHEVA
jgi:dTDP-4-amino-4,6-dideoxygalactose transaminase